jgi:hypothetical protein
MKLLAMKTVDGMIGFILRGVSHETEAKGPASISIPHHNALECMHTGNPVGLHLNTDSLGSE